MDKEYICSRLEKLSLLLYGKDCDPFAKKKKEMYLFGSRKYEIKNTVSKKVAMYLIIGTIK